MIDIKGFKGDKGNGGSRLIKKVTVFAVVLIVLVLIYNMLSYFVDYIQIKEIGEQYTSLFFKRLTVSLGIQGVSFLALFLIVLVNVFVVRGNLNISGIERGIIQTKRMSFLISFLIALLLGTAVSKSLTEKLLMFMNPQWFGKTDPIFGKDIGYYIFQRPFLMSVVDSLSSTWFFAACLAAVLYWGLGSAAGEYKARDLIKMPGIAIHNCINIGVFLLINCFSYVFKAENILYGSFGEFQGAGFTDKTIWLTCYRIAPYLSIVLIVLVAIFLFKRNTKAAIKTALIYPALWVLTGLVAFVVQTVIVSPNEVIKEKENISSNIEFTQDAYGLGDISEVVFDVNDDLQAQDIQSNKNVIDNIRILDLDANLTVLNQIQGIRNYYHFNETDIVP